MKIRCLTLGPMQANGYVLYASTPGGAWVVDAGDEAETILAELDRLRLTPELLVCTHPHVDHVGAIAGLRARYPELPIAIHEADAAALTDPLRNLSFFLGHGFAAPAATKRLKHGETLCAAGLTARVLHTPGHTPGGICLHFPEAGVLLTGDTLFAGGVGRCDFPGGSESHLLQAIHAELLTLPDDTRVYPGHGPETTIGAERRGNPYLAV